MGYVLGLIIIVMEKKMETIRDYRDHTRVTGLLLLERKGAHQSCCLLLGFKHCLRNRGSRNRLPMLKFFEQRVPLRKLS